MSPMFALLEVGARAGSSAANSDWALVLGAVAAVAVVVGYVVVLAMTVASWRASRHHGRWRGPRRVPVTRLSTGPVTPDELIEVHAALANVTSLRAIVRGASAVRAPDPTSAHHS